MLQVSQDLEAYEIYKLEINIELWLKHAQKTILSLYVF